MKYKDYFFDRENMTLSKRFYYLYYQELAQSIGCYISDVTQNFIINTLIVSFSFIYIVLPWLLLIFLALLANIPSRVVSLLLVSLVIENHFSSEKYRRKSSYFYEVLTEKYNEEIGVYESIVENLKKIYIEFKSKIQIENYIEDLFKSSYDKNSKFNQILEENIPDFQNTDIIKYVKNLMRIHYNTRYKPCKNLEYYGIKLFFEKLASTYAIELKRY